MNEFARFAGHPPAPSASSGSCSGRRLGSLKFRRQAALGPFIVDFYCPEARLVIELDGDSHDGRADYDFRRTAQLETMGLRVLRIANDEVLRDEEAVLRGIAHEAGIDLP